MKFRGGISAVLVSALVFQTLVQPVFAWNPFKNDREYNSQSWSYRDYFQKSDFQFKSSYQGQFNISARDSFMKNSLYDSQRTAWNIDVQMNWRRGVSMDGLINQHVAPNINSSDYAGSRIQNNYTFERFSNFNQKYEPYTYNNIHESNGLVNGFERTSARGSWKINESVSNLAYNADKLPASYSMTTRDIAGNTFHQNISNIIYELSPDSSRMNQMLDHAQNERRTQGTYNWDLIENQLKELPEPAQQVAKSFDLEMIDPQGRSTLMKFSDVQWSRDRVVGFTAAFEHDGIPTEVKAVPTAMDDGKVSALQIEVKAGNDKHNLEWKQSDRVNLTTLVAKLFSNPNPFEIMGGGHIQAGSVMLPAVAKNLNADGLLIHAKEDFQRNYAIVDSPIIGKERNEIKKKIHNFEQSDKTSTRAVLWDADLSKMSAKELGQSVEQISKTMNERFEGSNRPWAIEYESTWGEPIKPIGETKVDWSDGYINSSTEFTTPDGGKVTNVKFVFTDEGKLQAYQGTKTFPDGTVKQIGKNYETPQASAFKYEQAHPQTNFQKITNKVIGFVKELLINIGDFLALSPQNRKLDKNSQPMDDGKRFAANAPLIDGLEYMERNKINPFDSKNPISLEFNIRNDYRTLPILGVIPFVSKLWFAKGDNGSNVTANFYQSLDLTVEKITKSPSINFFIHGYNVTENGGLEFREKISQSLSSQQDYRHLNAGVSWSSDLGNNFITKLLYFRRSMKSADMSWPALKTAEKFLREINPKIKLNAVGHSLGNRLILESANNGVKYGTVIMLLPAIPKSSFSPGGRYEKALDNIDHLIIVYSRRQEFVFGVAYFLATFFRTSLGQYGPPKGFTHPKITFIDGTREKYNDLNMNIHSHLDYLDPETISLIAGYLRGVK